MPFNRLVELAKEYGLEFRWRASFKDLYKQFAESSRNPRYSNQEEQWAVCSLYCAFAFQKSSPVKRSLSEMDVVTEFK